MIFSVYHIYRKAKEKYDNRRKIYEGSHPTGEKAKALDEVPIGCVIVYEDKIIARGYNRRNTDKNTLSHAELNAIRKASKNLVTGDWKDVRCILR